MLYTTSSVDYISAIILTSGGAAIMVDTTFLTSTTNLIDPTTLSPALASPANECLIEV